MTGKGPHFGLCSLLYIVWVDKPRVFASSAGVKSNCIAIHIRYAVTATAYSIVFWLLFLTLNFCVAAVSGKHATLLRHFFRYFEVKLSRAR